MLLNQHSLAATVDALADARYTGRKIPKPELVAAVEWIAGRQGLLGSYAGMPAPLKLDFDKGARVFTGELIKSRASIAHVLGEEACRAIQLSGVKSKAVTAALKTATAGMLHCLSEAPAAAGMFCCGTCSVAYWRNLLAGGLDLQERRLRNGVLQLKAHRTDDGRYRRFPFYYTLLALSEMPFPSARAELRYAAPVCERLLKRPLGPAPYAARRRALLERVLGKA